MPNIRVEAGRLFVNLPSNNLLVELESPLSRRLDAIIRLLMEGQAKEGRLQRGDHLRILESVGLSSSEIGRIIGQPSKNVSSRLKKLKVRPKEGRRKS